MLLPPQLLRLEILNCRSEMPRVVKEDQLETPAKTIIYDPNAKKKAKEKGKEKTEEEVIAT